MERTLPRFLSFVNNLMFAFLRTQTTDPSPLRWFHMEQEMMRHGVYIWIFAPWAKMVSLENCSDWLRIARSKGSIGVHGRVRWFPVGNPLKVSGNTALSSCWNSWNCWRQGKYLRPKKTTTLGPEPPCGSLWMVTGGWRMEHQWFNGPAALVI